MRRMERALLALVVLAMSQGCASDSPVTRPSSGSTTPTSLTIAPIGTVTAGQQAQLRATAVLPDGRSEDVTSRLGWSSANEAIATVSSAGLLLAMKVGEVEIVAAFEGLTARITIAVRATPITPRFVVEGTIRDAPPTADVLVGGVAVSVVGGPLDGFTTTSDAQGRFELPSVAEPGFTLYFKKRGYEDIRFEVVDLPRDAHPVISLMPEAGTAVVSVSGPNSCQVPELLCGEVHEGCGPGSEFPVYRDGVVHIREALNPYWEHPVVIILQKTREGWRRVAHSYQSEWTAGAVVAVPGGFRYRVILTGGFPVNCPPYRLVFAHPR
jgi:hypothetical protein